MIVFQDTCQLMTESVDGYGDRQIASLTDIPCLFLQSTAYSHSSNVDIDTSDAHIYLDHEHPTIVALGFKLEGMTILVNPLGVIDDNSWYRITKVVVGQRKLLDNQVDNVHAYLKRIARDKP